MAERTITIRGMHCASCEKSLRRAFARAGIRAKNISHAQGTATVEYEGEKDLGAIVRAAGYALKESPAAAVPGHERNTVAITLAALVALTALQWALAARLYSRLPGYGEHLLLPLLALPAAVLINLAALWHQRAYQEDVSCMTGMMVGMTIGMTTGMTVGYIAGLLNGMFYGALIGAALAMGAGAYAGRCCGIMGTMEGLMAGLMGGTMGAMLGVMMAADHPLIFLLLLIAASAAILGGLMRVVYDEHRTHAHSVRAWPAWAVVAAGTGIMVALSILMLLLPGGFYG